MTQEVRAPGLERLTDADGVRHDLNVAADMIMDLLYAARTGKQVPVIAAENLAAALRETASRISAISSPSVPVQGIASPVVKALEWKVTTEVSHQATAIGLRYYVYHSNEDGLWHAYTEGYQPARFGQFGEIREAKAAAQADFDQRIRSRVEAMVERMCGTPCIEAFTPTPDEWQRCESIQDTYDLMKRRIRKGMATLAALTEASQNAGGEPALQEEAVPLRCGAAVMLSAEERAERVAKGLHVEWAEGVGYHYFPSHDLPTDEEIAAILADASPVTEDDKPLIEAFDRATAAAKARLSGGEQPAPKADGAIMDQHPDVPGSDDEMKRLIARLLPTPDHSVYGPHIPIARAIVHEYLRDDDTSFGSEGVAEYVLRVRIASAIALHTPAPNGVSGAVREALDAATIERCAQVAEACSNSAPKVAPAIARHIRSLFQEPSPSAREES